MLKAAEVRKKALLAWCFFLSLSLSFFSFSCFWLLISFQFIPFTSSLESCFSSPFFLYPPLWCAPPAPGSNFWFGGVLICYSRLGFWAFKGVDFGNMFLSFTEEVPQCPLEWFASKHTNRNHSAFPLQGSRETRKTWSWVAWIWSCLLICYAAHWFCLICSIQNGWAPKLRVHQLCNMWNRSVGHKCVWSVVLSRTCPIKSPQRSQKDTNNVHTQYHQYLSVWLHRSQVTKNQRRVEKIPAAARISVSCDILRGMDRCFVQGSQCDCDLVYEVGLLENLWNIKRGGNVNCKFATFDEEGSTRRARSAEASGRAWHFAEVRCQVRLCTVLGHQNWAQTDWTAGLRTPPDSVRARISWKELRAKSKARLGIQNVLKRRQWFKQIQRASYCQFSVFLVFSFSLGCQRWNQFEGDCCMMLYEVHALPGFCIRFKECRFV